jgi:hypothetical protein
MYSGEWDDCMRMKTENIELPFLCRECWDWAFWGLPCLQEGRALGTSFSNPTHAILDWIAVLTEYLGFDMQFR